MMVLANVESLLIKMLYVDGVERNIELLDISMDSAANQNLGLGSATLVEECRCPPGYRGLSCESCDYGYVRQSSGPWLGRCVAQEQECRPDTMEIQTEEFHVIRVHARLVAISPELEHVNLIAVIM